MKLDILSKNLILIINRTLENQELAKMIYYDIASPLSQPDVTNPKTLFMNRVFPYPYISEVTTDEMTQLMIYYGKTDIDYVENTNVIFDIILHKNLYLIKDQDNVSLLRPYEIANRITQQFDGDSIKTVGKLHFLNAIPIMVDSNYQMLRLIAEMMTIASGK